VWTIFLYPAFRTFKEAISFQRSAFSFLKEAISLQRSAFSFLRKRMEQALPIEPDSTSGPWYFIFSS
jgi:hypothetical protein